VSYKQIVGFNPAIAGTTKYLCLSNVRKGYGIAAKYASAWQAWQNTQQHTDAIPGGVAVPVFWEWTGTVDGITANYGHIAVSLPDGRVWTDGKYYANTATLNTSYLAGRGKYVGWGETLNGVRVVEQVQGGTMADNVITKNDAIGMRIIASEIKGWDFQEVHSGKYDASELAAWTGHGWNDYLYFAWKEGAGYRYLKSKYENFYKTYESQISELSARPTKDELAKLGEALKNEQAKVVEAEKALEEAKKQGGGISEEDSAAIKETNSVVNWIKTKLEGLFK